MYHHFLCPGSWPIEVVQDSWNGKDIYVFTHFNDWHKWYLSRHDRRRRPPPLPPIHSSLNSHRQKEFIAHLHSLPLSSTSYLFPGLCYPFKSEIWTKESRRNYLATLLATKWCEAVVLHYICTSAFGASFDSFINHGHSSKHSLLLHFLKVVHD